MARHTATPGSVGYDLCEADADGVGVRRLTVYGPIDQSAEDAARLLALAMTLSGGIPAATALIRAALIREQDQPDNAR
jgi:hypothetical protein